MNPIPLRISPELWYKLAAMIIWKHCPNRQCELTAEDVEAFSKLFPDQGGPAISTQSTGDGLHFRILPNAIARDLAKATGAEYRQPGEQL